MTPRDSGVDLDFILLELGSFGKYQVINYVLILLPILYSGLFASQYIFAAGGVSYRCKVPECETAPLQFEPGEWGLWALPEGGGRCDRLIPLDEACTDQSFHLNQTMTCDTWIYQDNSTIVSEFGLACEEWKRTLVGTVHNAGVLAALGITSVISDVFGRKIAFVATAVAAGVAGVIRAFSPNYIMYIIMEFIEASVGAGVYSTGFILALEMVGQNRRVLGGNLISSTFALGQVMLALLAWAAPYWRTLTLLIYVPPILFLVYYFLIEESVRWLLSKGRKSDAAKIIYKVADVNKKKLSPASIKMLSEEPSMQVKRDSIKSDQNNGFAAGLESNTNQRSLFIRILKSRTLVTRVAIISFWWITLTFVYYGLSINSVSLAGNMYVNYILTSLVEIPGYCISFLTLDRYGRKRSIITALFICGISLIILPFTPSGMGWLQVTLNMIGKLSISMAFSSIYIYTSELFPTEARHTLLGTCSMIGRVGSLLAPQTPLLMAYMEALPYLIFGIMAGISGLLMLLTPETLHMRLPDTIAQAENINFVAQAKRSDDVAD